MSITTALERGVARDVPVRRVLVGGAIVLFGLRLALSLARSGPVVMADEAGYLMHARVLAGGMPAEMGSSPFYRGRARGWQPAQRPVAGTQLRRPAPRRDAARAVVAGEPRRRRGGAGEPRWTRLVPAGRDARHRAAAVRRRGSGAAARLVRRRAQPGDAALAIVVLATAGLLLASALWFAVRDRPDQLVYGALWLLALVRRRTPGALGPVVLVLFAPTTAYIAYLPVLRSQSDVYPVGWTSPRPVVERLAATRVGYDLDSFDHVAVKTYQWALPHTRVVLFESRAQPPPSPLFFSGAKLTGAAARRGATAVWRDPGRDQVLWQVAER